MATYVESLVDGLNEIVGRELASVIFVRDYVQFDFDGPIISFVVDPEVRSGGVVRSFPSDGSRDLLCAQIGKKVTGIRHSEDVIIIDFDGSSAVSVATAGSDGQELTDEVIDLYEFPSDAELLDKDPRDIMRTDSE